MHNGESFLEEDFYEIALANPMDFRLHAQIMIHTFFLS